MIDTSSASLAASAGGLRFCHPPRQPRTHRQGDIETDHNAEQLDIKVER